MGFRINAGVQLVVVRGPRLVTSPPHRIPDPNIVRDCSKSSNAQVHCFQ